jgi:hypothetical protein
MIARRGFEISKKTPKNEITSTFAMLWTFLRNRPRVSDKRPRTMKHTDNPWSAKQKTCDVELNPEFPAIKTVALRKVSKEVNKTFNLC